MTRSRLRWTVVAAEDGGSDRHHRGAGTGGRDPTVISPIGPVVARVTVPSGRAALYTIPEPESWEIILNPSTS